MVDLDDGDNGEKEPDITGDITQELLHVQGLLLDLEGMQPTLKTDIDLISQELERVRNQVDIFDTRLEELDYRGELEDGRQIRDIAKVLTDMGGHLDALLAGHTILLDTRMQLEVAMTSLRKSRDELLASIPTDKKH
ncbi:MAG: hypothetical protein Q7R90_00275 [bacterium]|nr:hypothetical protein [bacterium]